MDAIRILLLVIALVLPVIGATSILKHPSVVLLDALALFACDICFVTGTFALLRMLKLL